METGLKDGDRRFLCRLEARTRGLCRAHEEHLFENTRIVLGRKGRPPAKARSLRDLVEAKPATTTVTLKAEEELREVFEGARPADATRRAAKPAGADDIVVRATSDLLTVVPIQWTKFTAVSQSPSPIFVTRRSVRAPRRPHR